MAGHKSTIRHKSQTSRDLYSGSKGNGLESHIFREIQILFKIMRLQLGFYQWDRVMWVFVGHEIRGPESTMGGKNHSQSQIRKSRGIERWKLMSRF